MVLVVKARRSAKDFSHSTSNEWRWHVRHDRGESIIINVGEFSPAEELEKRPGKASQLLNCVNNVAYRVVFGVLQRRDAFGLCVNVP